MRRDISIIWDIMYRRAILSCMDPGVRVAIILYVLPPLCVKLSSSVHYPEQHACIIQPPSSTPPSMQMSLDAVSPSQAHAVLLSYSFPSLLYLEEGERKCEVKVSTA